MHVMLGRNFISLVDEPEAFLHPPQARLLGRLLGAERADYLQLFVATHSADFLRGALDSNDQNIRIIRLRREGEVNKVTELTPDDLRRSWADPTLRYSNVLDGVFHEQVVVCEADGDCRF